MKIRPAVAGDSVDVFDWRNDPLTVQMSLNARTITWDEHDQWFCSVLSTTHVKLFIAEVDEEKIGISRFDLDTEQETAVSSINLNPKFRGKNLSSELLRRSLEELQMSHCGPVYAQIHVDNVASKKLFSRAGFKLQARHDQFFQFRYDP